MLYLYMICSLFKIVILTKHAGFQGFVALEAMLCQVISSFCI